MSIFLIQEKFHSHIGSNQKNKTLNQNIWKGMSFYPKNVEYKEVKTEKVSAS